VIDATIFRSTRKNRHRRVELKLVSPPHLIPGDDDSTDHTPYGEEFKWVKAA
jgi:hypothetical protein